MVYINFKDLEGLEINSQQGADLGFTGKQVIHPNNIQTVQRVFSPRRAFERLFSLFLNLFLFLSRFLKETQSTKGYCLSFVAPIIPLALSV